MPPPSSVPQRSSKSQSTSAPKKVPSASKHSRSLLSPAMPKPRVRRKVKLAPGKFSDASDRVLVLRFHGTVCIILLGAWKTVLQDHWLVRNKIRAVTSRCVEFEVCFAFSRRVIFWLILCESLSSTCTFSVSLPPNIWRRACWKLISPTLRHFQDWEAHNASVDQIASK